MKQRLFHMLTELSRYHRPRATCMSEYVQERLDKSFNTYEQELQQSLMFLSTKHEKSLIKRIKNLDDKSHK